MAHGLPWDSTLEAHMHSFTDYFFLAAVMLPPLALAIGFLIAASPRAIERAERTGHAGHVTAQTH